MWRMPALSHRPVEIILQLLAVTRMDAIRDDPLRPFTGRQITDVRKAVLCDQHIHIMLGMVDMGSEWHDTGNPPVLSSGFSDEYGELRIAPEIARSADAVHHFRSGDMGRIYIAVQIEFQSGVDGNKAKAPDDFRMIGDYLRTQHQSIPVAAEILI